MICPSFQPHQRILQQRHKQFLGVAKQIKALDDKVTKLDKDVYAIGQLVVHLKGDVCWVKKHLEDNAETESGD